MKAHHEASIIKTIGRGSTGSEWPVEKQIIKSKMALNKRVKTKVLSQLSWRNKGPERKWFPDCGAIRKLFFRLYTHQDKFQADQTLLLKHLKTKTMKVF